MQQFSSNLSLGYITYRLEHNLNIIYVQTKNVRKKIACLKPRKHPIFRHLQHTVQVPSEKVYWDLLLNLPERTVSELRMLNKRLLSKKARTDGPGDVVLNVDDTVCTVYGDQEGAGIGYNPQKNGRASFKEKVGILAQTNEVINLTIENGKHHANFELITFFQKCRRLLPSP